ncbi:MAG TPA: hypothetical protein VJK07_04040 [Candidatus Nanoarchaeia archaeon]|nr:hypothetical protein [Candidatus Nanoarchaeia archaeon]
MKAIQTAEQRESSRKRRTQVMGIVLVVLMLGSTIGYAFSLFFSSTSPDTAAPQILPPTNQPITINHNGLSFQLLSVQDDIAGIPVNITVRISDYVNFPVFIAAEEVSANQELTAVIGRYASRIQQACYGPCAQQDLPEKECDENLIVVNASTSNSIFQQERCIFIQGDIRAVDAFLYNLFQPS